MLAAAGVEAPGNLPGLNILPELESGKATPRKEVFGESFSHDVAEIDNPEATLLYRWIIEGKWKLLLTYDGKLGRYASSHPRTEKRPQLYDLLSDSSRRYQSRGDESRGCRPSRCSHPGVVAGEPSPGLDRMDRGTGCLKVVSGDGIRCTLA